jgi:hypothetical protein
MTTPTATQRPLPRSVTGAGATVGTPAADDAATANNGAVVDEVAGPDCRPHDTTGPVAAPRRQVDADLEALYSEMAWHMARMDDTWRRVTDYLAGGPVKQRHT